MEEGFTTIKVKVGTNVDEDVERVRIVREEIGPERQILIDANCGWDAPTAIAAVRKMQKLGLNVGVFEQPTTDGDYGALAEVRRALGPEVQIMADDIVFDLVHARECLRNNAVDVVSVYPGKCGGIGRTKRIVAFCESRGVPCSIGSNLELDVATAAMAHVVVGLANMQVETYPGDVLGPEYHEFPVVKGPVEIRGPEVTVPSGPGLGVEVDWELVGRHAGR